MKISRRNFLKSTGLVMASYPFAQMAEGSSFQSVASENVPDWRETITPTICQLCQSKCPMIAKSIAGKLTHLAGNPKAAFSNGRICAKGHAASKLLYDPDRIKYPLKQIGKRGEGKFVRISWGEAIDTIINKLEIAIKKDGPESIALFANGSSSRHIIELFNELKIENINNATNEFCTANSDSAFIPTFGDLNLGSLISGFEKAECIVLFGSHFGENIQVSEIGQITEALAQGKKLIVVDPRVSVIASKADYHLMIRPGTDNALMLGWINYIIENRFYNRDFIENSTIGFSALRQKAAEFPLKKVAQLTDLPLKTLSRCAEVIASSAPDVLFYPGKFSAWYGNDSQRIRALAILKTLLSNSASFSDFTLDKVMARNSRTYKFLKNITYSPPAGPSSSSILRKTSNGEIKVLGCWGQNPFHASPNPYKTIASYEKADFTFCCDILPTEAVLYSDIVLPEATFLERMDGLETWFDVPKHSIGLSFPVVEPLSESKGPYWIVKQLSSRLGKGRKFHYDSITDRLNSELKKIRLSVERIKGNNGIISFTDTNIQVNNEPYFLTPSGKVELFSDNLQEKAGLPLPDFVSVSLPPKGYSRLINGRNPVHSSTTCNNPWLNHEIEENELWLNNRIAKMLAILDGDRLFLENQDGIRSIKPIKIKVTPGIRVDCVFMAHGFGMKSPFLKLAFNRGLGDETLMTRSNPDPVSGARGLRVNFVRFVKNGKVLDIPQLDNPPNFLKDNSRWWFDSFGSFEKGASRKNYV